MPMLWAFRKNEQGRMEHRYMDSGMLGNGWYDSPSKVPGSQKIMAHEEAVKAETAGTVGERVRDLGQIHGDYTPKRKPGRPRKNG